MSFMARERILLVDDEPGIVKAVSITLERLGYNVRIARSATEELEDIRERAI